MANILAIVGRPNVGKSTFFNRMTGGRRAIVDSVAGVTRDRHYGEVEWNGKTFTIIDTGGYVLESDELFDKEIRKQVNIAMEEATAIVFMVDTIDGITGMDKEVAKLLRTSEKPVFLVANKVDNNKRIAEAAEFYQLGLGEVYNISSVNGSGTGDLLDEIVKHFQVKEEEEFEEDIPRIAVVGRPNAGKSSLINTLVGEERNIVTPMAGTTRDTTNVLYKGFGHEFYLVDTAGIRKKSKVHENLEFYSVLRAITAIEHADVCLLMIDAMEGVGAQDVNIFSLIQKNHKGVVILINKWDLVEKEPKIAEMFKEEVKLRLSPFEDVDIVFTSVLTKQRVLKAFDAAIKAYHNRRRRIKTSKLNEWLLPVIEKNPPPSVKGKYVKIKYVTQLPTKFPAFAFFCNSPQYVKEAYKRFLENQVRKQFDFTGVPIKLYFRQK